MLRLTLLDWTKAAKPEEKVYVKFKVTNTYPTAVCAKVNVWWRQDKVAGDFYVTIDGNSSKVMESYFYMPDKPEDPTKLSLNVYKGPDNPAGMMDCLLGRYNSAPDDFKVFSIDKITGTANLVVDDIVLDKTTAYVGEKVTAKFWFKNIGTATGSKRFEITKDGQYVTSFYLTLDPSEREYRTWNFTFNTAGSHRICADGVCKYIWVEEEPQAEMSISNLDVLTPSVRVGEDVKVRFTVRNTTNEAKCFKAIVWWNQEKIADLVDSVDALSSKTTEITFKMPDKPENPVKFNLAVYKGSAPAPLIGCMMASFDEYASDSKDFTVEKEAPSRGIKVVLKDPPKAGKVVLAQPVAGGFGTEIPIDERDVTDTTEYVLFETLNIPSGTTLVVRLEDQTGFVLDRKEVNAPEYGVITVTLYGYGGAHYWTKVYTNTTTVISGDPVKVYTKAYRVPNQPLGAGHEINFYMRKKGEEEWSFIGTNITDDKGIAVFQTVLTAVEEDKEMYEFMAQVGEEPTYSDIATVAVVKKPSFGLIDSIAELLHITPEQAKQLIILLFVAFFVLLLLR